MTGATAHHWAEILKHGTTTFHSDDEIRVVSKDAIMREALDEKQDDGLHQYVAENTEAFLFLTLIICNQKLEAKMKEALHDYYS
jgi:hypothetical protein